MIVQVSVNYKIDNEDYEDYFSSLEEALDWVESLSLGWDEDFKDSDFISSFLINIERGTSGS